MSELSPQSRYEEGKREFKESFIEERLQLFEGKTEEEKKALRTRLIREATIIYDEALRYFAENASTAESLQQFQVTLVQLPEFRAQEITERIQEAEHSYSPDSSADGYTEGSATSDDEIKTIEGSQPVLLTAEHATDQIRNDAKKSADWGTGGLTEVIATDHGTFAVTATGRQTGDANYNDSHPLKTQAGLLVVEKRLDLALSIHGMGTGKYLTEGELLSQTSSDIAIGIGREHNDKTLEFAEWLRGVAQTLELKADINPWYLAVDQSGDVRYKDSLPLRNSFRADKARTTRSHLATQTQEQGLIIPVAQIELSSDLRVGPTGKNLNFEKIYKAYLLLSEAVLKYSIGHSQR